MAFNNKKGPHFCPKKICHVMKTLTHFCEHFLKKFYAYINTFKFCASLYNNNPRLHNLVFGLVALFIRISNSTLIYEKISAFFKFSTQCTNAVKC